MPVMYTIAFALIAACFSALVAVVLCERDIEQLERENQMFRRLLADQANLNEMSLNAYIAMLQASSSRTGR